MLLITSIGMREIDTNERGMRPGLWCIPYNNSRLEEKVPQHVLRGNPLYFFKTSISKGTITMEWLLHG